jgi:ABC-2 type transport system permease protein
MNDFRLVWHEFSYERRIFQRDPVAVFTTVGLPLLYMVIFVSLFGEGTLGFQLEQQPGPLRVGTVMTASFIAIGIVSAAFFNLAVKLVEAREAGELKRFRGTPLPAWVFIAGHAGTSLILAVALSAFLALLARLAYGVPIPIASLPAFALAVVTGATAFSCLGFAFTTLVRKAGAAVPAGMGLTLTLYFISGNFIIMEDWPGLIRIVATIFPVKHLNLALLTALNPNVTGIAGTHLLVVIIWGIAGLILSLRFFRWSPSAE